MKVLSSLEKSLDHPCVITIGTYDSVHLGHQSVIKETFETAKRNQALSVVITYANHPLTVLKPDLKLCRLITQEHQIKLFEELGVDAVFFLTFTKEFSTMSAEQFLIKLDRAAPIKALVLGYDSTIGKDKQGNKEVVEKIAHDKGFDVHYMNELQVEDVTISSSKIRQAIFTGDFKTASRMLGRPYSIYTPNVTTEGVLLEGLCLPPDGKYSVTVLGSTYNGELKNNFFRFEKPLSGFTKYQPVEIVFTK
jgi:riboflavin kinase/FMN adenylyltransferase